MRASRGGGAKGYRAYRELCQRSEVRAQAANYRAEFEFGTLVGHLEQLGVLGLELLHDAVLDPEDQQGDQPGGQRDDPAVACLMRVPA